MPDLRLIDIAKHYGSVEAVAGVDLVLPHGKLVCFLGPSGCGKTTLLRLIAGLERPSQGRIHLGDTEITETPAHRRGIGMVFQSLALFPHLTVAENIAYGLRIRGQARDEIGRRINALLGLVHLDGYGDRTITQLSGGQRQRVAIARALVLEPDLFLLDEPLSALDAKLREAMQVELRLLQQRLGITTILVTHDQREAMTTADLIVVMSQGRVQQLGRPLEIYRQPANAFVARFMGTTNVLEGLMRGNRAVEVDGRVLPVLEVPPDLRSGNPALLSIRPEDLGLCIGGSQAPPDSGTLPGIVRFVRDMGPVVETYVTCGDRELIAAHPPTARPAVVAGDPVILTLPSAACVVLHPD